MPCSTIQILCYWILYLILVIHFSLFFLLLLTGGCWCFGLILTQWKLERQLELIRATARIAYSWKYRSTFCVFSIEVSSTSLLTVKFIFYVLIIWNTKWSKMKSKSYIWMIKGFISCILTYLTSIICMDSFYACSENSPMKDCNLTAQEIRSIRYIILIDFNLQISYTN